jgi:hypothetical protein
LTSDRKYLMSETFLKISVPEVTFITLKLPSDYCTLVYYITSFYIFMSAKKNVTVYMRGGNHALSVNISLGFSGFPVFPVDLLQSSLMFLGAIDSSLDNLMSMFSDNVTNWISE